MNRKLIGPKFYVIILSLIFLMGCQSREKKMKTDIEAANKAYCPMNFGNFGSLNSMEFDDGRLIYTFELKEPDLISLIEDNESVKKLYANYFMRIVSSSLKNIFSQGYDCIIKFSSPTMSRSAVLELNSEEAEKILQDNYSKKEIAIEGARLSCIASKCKVPIDLGDGTIITNVSFLNNTIIYDCEVEDEKNSDLSNLGNTLNISDLKRIILDGFFQEYTDLLMKQYILGDVSIEYRYIGKKSKTEFSIVISPNEMREYLKSKEEESQRMKDVYRAMKRKTDANKRFK